MSREQQLEAYVGLLKASRDQGEQQVVAQAVAIQQLNDALKTTQEQLQAATDEVSSLKEVIAKLEADAAGPQAYPADYTVKAGQAIELPDEGPVRRIPRKP